MATSLLLHRICFTVTILLFFVPAVSAKKLTLVEDNWEISASDVDCTVSWCTIPATICNLDVVPRSYSVEFVAQTVEPVGAQALVEEPYMESEPVYDLVSLYNETTDSTEMVSVISHYVDVPRTRTLQLEQSTTEKNFDFADASKRGLSLAANSFNAAECKEYQFLVRNVIGGSWKYDVNFLDPFINSTQYEIGNTTNNSNTWNTDMNLTTSSVTLSASNKTFSIGGLREGLVLYLPLDSSVTDVHGGYTVNNTGITALPSGSCKIGTCYDWDSSSDNVKIGAEVFQNRSAGTINMWTWLDTTATYQRNVFGYHNTTWLRSQLYTATNDVPYFQVGGESALDTGSNKVKTGVWAMLTFAWNSSGRFIYFNGTQVASNATTGTTATGGIFCLGNNPNCNHANEWWDGRFDEFGFWGRALTAAEIAQLYNGGSGLNYSGITYNAAGTFSSVPISYVNNNSGAFIPTWRYAPNGGSVTVNVTCDANNPSPTWTGSLTNGTLAACPISGNSFRYQVTLSGNTTNSPVMQNLTIVFSLLANEASGRQAIADGIAASIASSGSSYTDQQVYERLSNGSQYLGTFDVFFAAGNKRYAFNYNQNNTTTHPVFHNVTPVLHVWQAYNLSVFNIQTAVQQFIDSTYN